MTGFSVETSLPIIEAENKSQTNTKFVESFNGVEGTGDKKVQGKLTMLTTEPWLSSAVASMSAVTAPGTNSAKITIVLKESAVFDDGSTTAEVTLPNFATGIVNPIASALNKAVTPANFKEEFNNKPGARSNKVAAQLTMLTGLSESLSIRTIKTLVVTNTSTITADLMVTLTFGYVFANGVSNEATITLTGFREV